MPVIPDDTLRQWLKEEGLDDAAVEKALYVIHGESGGDSGAVGDGGAARGLFQVQSNKAFSSRPSAEWLDDPRNNIRYAVHNLGIANGDYSAWGENNTFNGQKFGALGNHPYPGGSVGTIAGGQVPGKFQNLSAPGDPTPTYGQGSGWKGYNQPTAPKPQMGASAAAAAAVPLDASGQPDWAKYFSGQAAELVKRAPSQANKASWFDPKSTQSEAEQLAQAQATHQSLVAVALQNAKSFAQQTSGFVTLPNGTIVPTANMTPEQYAAVAANNQAIVNKAKNDIALDRQKYENEVRQATYNSTVTAHDEGLKDNAQTLAKAQQDQSRVISGLAESRGRSDYVSKTLAAAVPWATTGGKTSFGLSDLGGLGAKWGSLLGMDPNSSVLNYPGTTHIDPQGLLAQYDKQLGVEGGIPTTPDLKGLDPVGTLSLQGAPTLLDMFGDDTQIDPTTGAVTNGTSRGIAAKKAQGLATGLSPAITSLLQGILGWGKQTAAPRPGAGPSPSSLGYGFQLPSSTPIKPPPPKNWWEAIGQAQQ